MHSDRLRVLLFSPQGAGVHYNGAGTTFFRMYAKADRADLKVSLLHGSSRQEGAGVYVAEHRVADLQSGILSQARFIRAAKSWIKKNYHRFDVMHVTTGYLYGAAPAGYAESLGLPVALTTATHRGDLGFDASVLSRLLRTPQRRQQIVRQLSATIATSSSIVAELQGYGVPSAKIHKIPYGVDCDQFQVPTSTEKRKLRAELGWQDRPTVLFVGGICRRKRPHLLIEALPQVVSQQLDCQIALVGPEQDADYVAEMRNSAAASGVADRIYWAGLQVDVARYYQAADVFVLPSMREGLPNAMLEAMACGLPVIGTRISGALDLIEPGVDGFLIEPDAEDLAAAITHYARAPDLACAHGKKSRAKIDESYSIDVVLPKYLQLFQQIRTQ